MDSLLPFRALSPGARNSNRAVHKRPKESKLSLKSHKAGVVDAKKGNKENKPPVTRRGCTLAMPAFKYLDSDIMTSDESDCDVADKLMDGKHTSVMSFGTQESTFSLPIAESTRCELPASQPNQSTIASLHTARDTSSSDRTQYYTACPYPTGCDESIVCLSDSPESLKKVAKMTNPTVSVVITSDESDCESEKLYPNPAVGAEKLKEKKLFDTVILDTSSSDDSDSIEEGSGCDLVIPPSIKSDKSSRGSLCSDNIEIQHRVGSEDLIIPPSPERNSDTSSVNSLISEDGVPSKKSSSKIMEQNDQRETSRSEKQELTGVISQQKEIPDSFMFSGKFLGPDSNAASCKDDSHSSMPVSSKSRERSIKSALDGSDMKSRNVVGGTISKEKYDDIARWLFSGKDSLDDKSDVSDQCKSTEEAFASNDVGVLRHPQVRKLSIVRRSSFGSESDDNFNALMDSVKKRSQTSKELSLENRSSVYDNSFIDDDCASDVVESPSFNIYHSDLTRSIKAEVNSVKRSVRSMKKRHIFQHLNDSDEECSDGRGESPVATQGKCRENKLKGRRNRHYVSDSEDSILDSGNCWKSNRIIADDSDSDEEPVRASATTSKIQHDSINKSEKSDKNLKVNRIISDSSDSVSEVDGKFKTQSWRKKADHSNSTESSSSTSSLDLPKRHPKGSQKDCFETPVKPCRLPKYVVSKRIENLRSPRTPRSPIRTFLSSLSGPTHDPGVRDHPESIPYNSNFKSKKEELTRRLFKLFNREVFNRQLPEDLVLEWNARLVRTAGLCYCKLARKGGITTRTAKIALSAKVITSPDRLRDTLIHEMCHAAVWLLNNVSGGHGPFWKAWAQKAIKRFPELPPIQRCHSYKIETKYTYKCTKCGYSFGRHSKSLDVVKKRCGYCYGTFEVFLSSKGQSNKEVVLKTPKAPSAFALFVKENYGLLKKENGNLKHGDIMKKLGENFASMKVRQSED